MKNVYTENGKRCRCVLQMIFLFFAAVTSQDIDLLPVSEGVGLKKHPVFFLDFYQYYLSPLDGRHCPMYPSCSQYARGVIEHYSLLQACPLICDRLLRCGHDFNTYTDTIIEQRLRLIDHPYQNVVASVISDKDSIVKSVDGAAMGNGGNYLYRNGFYEQAYFEYVRSLLCDRDSATILKAAFAAYYAYDYRRFTREVVLLVKLLPEEQRCLRGELYLLAAKRCYSEGLYPTAYAVLEKYRSYFTTPVLHGEYRLLSKVNALFCDIDSVPELTESDFFEGSPLASYPGRIDSLNYSLDHFRKRSAAAAGVLSAIVPGAGYALGDRKRTALFSLLLNGLIAWATVGFVQQENYGAAAFAVILGSGFYTGSIVGSMRAVDAYNMGKRHLLIKRSLHDLDVDP